MLLVRPGPDVVVVENLLHLGEEHGLLVVVVRLDELVPRQGVADEGGLVLVTDVRGLLIDAVVAAQDGIVEERHVRRTGREDVGLFSFNPVVSCEGGNGRAGGRGRRTFFVSNCGVETSFMGLSAQGFVPDGSVIVYRKGPRLIAVAMRAGMAMKRRLAAIAKNEGRKTEG